MTPLDSHLAIKVTRRRLLSVGTVGVGMMAVPNLAGGTNQSSTDLHMVGGPSERPFTSAFPGKGKMVLQRLHPPLLETPISVFNRDIFTPNDQFFVRWHWGDIPTSIDVDRYQIMVRGAVQRPIAINLSQLLRMPRVEVAAVNQCSGNSRGYFQPRVPGAQWGHGAMGNALWLGVPLRHVLDLAGVNPEAVAVRFGALDQPLVRGAPAYEKSLDIDDALNGEAMLAFGMNGVQLPLLNGFPVRLVVPGWYSTYWIKMLNDIEVLSAADDRFWTAKAYKIPANSRADVRPGEKDYPTVPISRMVPRSWVTSLEDGQKIAYAPVIPIGGIAMGGDSGVARVEVSSDHGRTWKDAKLGEDAGRFSFRRWDTDVRLTNPGVTPLMVRCTNRAGVVQPMTPNWNPSGFMRGHVETIRIEATRS
ncbi:molybdopterin-dependent oxidoreductase [Sphingobium sp. SA916]|uniref:molybdopterin-dependent oxidoreductase n=1 Tax=Sphingobium sp. SA916 TaxID=1851207 RepID=UPI000C9F6225|nr:molybdopterin-dependent oxidoreductase [Sphingobium sp. SA916]PNQ04038.1 oxidase [Sphingobium sp. SA916]